MKIDTAALRRRAAIIVIAIGIMQATAPAALAAPAASAPHVTIGHAATTNAAIVVYGGTPGGILAAIAARRSGAASVVLLEPSAHVGGMMSSGLTATDYGDRATINGITIEFFRRMEAIEGSAQGRWHFQSKNAERVYKAMLAEAGVAVRYNARLLEAPAAVTKSGARLTAITLTDGSIYTAKIFIDATYEGDLMARAGVGHAIGREARTTYGETLAGVQPSRNVVRNLGGMTPAAVGFPVSAPGPVGTADNRIQGSNFRVCLSTSPTNQVPFAMPAGYDPAHYEIVARYLIQRASSGAPPQLSWVLWTTPMVNNKHDANDFGAMSLSVPGANYDYPTATYARRAEITAWHKGWTQGFLYFLATDERVPAEISARMNDFGLCKDEFIDNGNWPYQLYLREGRRMIGTRVLTQHDIQTLRSKPDIIGIASYRVDAHYVSRWLDGAGNLMAEGQIETPTRVRYAMPYSIMIPARAQATNILVPVAVSASHVAHASLRMEPQYMMMGEAAGTAAAMAAAGNGVVQDVHVPTLQSKLRARGTVLTDPGDIGTSMFYADIVWAWQAGIISPCADGRFCPTAAVTREMMASFLARALKLPPASRDYFTDDAASPHQDAINRVAQAGITKGCTATRFCPTATVTRDQMASFLVRAFRLPATSRDFFTDDEGSIHEADINRLAASGITMGCAATRFCPKNVVSRGEMMAFLHRAMT